MTVKIGRNDLCPSGCRVHIPWNLHDGHGIARLCGSTIWVDPDTGRRIALCPKHAGGYSQLSA